MCVFISYLFICFLSIHLSVYLLIYLFLYLYSANTCKYHWIHSVWLHAITIQHMAMSIRSHHPTISHLSSPSQSSMTNVCRRPWVTGCTQCALWDRKTRASPFPKWWGWRFSSLSWRNDGGGSEGIPDCVQLFFARKLKCIWVAKGG